HDYPKLKLVLNRLANAVIRILFRHGYNDTTNAFKAYRREVIQHAQPLLSHHFNLTVELPLKAFVRGFSYAVVPISWRNRTSGKSKLGIREMGSRYLFIVLTLYLEHHLSRGDYRRPGYSETAKRARVGLLFHLAAQTIVRVGHEDPVGTYATNVLGTANVLEAARSAPSLRAVVVVTSDKCYRPRADGRPSAEGDPLGGDDPYSSSK